MALPPYDRQRLKEVFAGLASDERARSFLESPAVVWVDATPHPGQLMIGGRRLGAYQVQALLGAGGMGEVYRARDRARPNAAPDVSGASVARAGHPSPICRGRSHIRAAGDTLA